MESVFLFGFGILIIKLLNGKVKKPYALILIWTAYFSYGFE